MSGAIMVALASFVTAAIGALGYAGIAALMAIESACIPLPSELIMPFSGYLVSTGRYSLLAVATAGALGCNIGSSLAYWAGARGGRPLVERWGRYVLLSHAELDRAEGYFRRWGAATVFVGRLLPVVRTFVSLPAGIARMPVLKFQIYTFLGSWPWCFALAYAGLKLGQAWNASQELKAEMHALDGVALVAILIGAAWYGRHLWRNRG